ncbi:hypothetical protein HMPREF1254_2001 [Prevotella sp. BV3P1]|uniref:hypothetical protein n=1 Tax=Prevotellaceae TaxID=171552 RepID=UPI0003B7E73E|nr:MULTISPECIES: hypothetical protein [Prevotellaceae]ERT61340.1 hypothetical protein HMPREF1254_2001 [Prevotella sp. BV3P1]
MVQQHIAAIRDVPLVGHDQDGNTRQVRDVKLGQGISQGRLWQNEHFASCLSPMPCATYLIDLLSR